MKRLLREVQFSYVRIWAKLFDYACGKCKQAKTLKQKLFWGMVAYWSD